MRKVSAVNPNTYIQETNDFKRLVFIKDVCVDTRYNHSLFNGEAHFYSNDIRDVPVTDNPTTIPVPIQNLIPLGYGASLGSARGLIQFPALVNENNEYLLCTATWLNNNRPELHQYGIDMFMNSNGLIKPDKTLRYLFVYEPATYSYFSIIAHIYKTQAQAYDLAISTGETQYYADENIYIHYYRDSVQSSFGIPYACAKNIGVTNVKSIDASGNVLTGLNVVYREFPCPYEEPWKKVWGELTFQGNNPPLIPAYENVDLYYIRDDSNI